MEAGGSHNEVITRRYMNDVNVSRMGFIGFLPRQLGLLEPNLFLALRANVNGSGIGLLNFRI